MNANANFDITKQKLQHQTKTHPPLSNGQRSNALSIYPSLHKNVVVNIDKVVLSISLTKRMTTLNWGEESSTSFSIYQMRKNLCFFEYISHSLFLFLFLFFLDLDTHSGSTIPKPRRTNEKYKEKREREWMSEFEWVRKWCVCQPPWENDLSSGNDDFSTTNDKRQTTTTHSTDRFMKLSLTFFLFGKKPKSIDYENNIIILLGSQEGEREREITFGSGWHTSDWFFSIQTFIPTTFWSTKKRNFLFLGK